jgi:hypothetical protein
MPDAFANIQIVFRQTRNTSIHYPFSYNVDRNYVLLETLTVTVAQFIASSLVQQKINI